MKQPFYERQEEEFAAGARSRYEEILQEQTDDS